MQDLETRAPMTAASLFRIYSMTKPVTAVAVMMLHEDGTFRLDDPVAKYLPEFDDVMMVATRGEAPRRPSRDDDGRRICCSTLGLEPPHIRSVSHGEVRSREISLPTFIDNITRAPLMEDPGTGSATARRRRCSAGWSRSGRAELRAF